MTWAAREFIAAMMSWFLVDGMAVFPLLMAISKDVVVTTFATMVGAGVTGATDIAGVGPSEGEELGTSDPSRVGPAEGEELGTSDPSGVGPSEGEELGTSDPSGVGPAEGEELGTSGTNGVGPAEGEELGTSGTNGVGPAEGDALGTSDPNGVGPAEGDPLGSSDPNGVGPAEGDALGPSDLSGVGPSEGDALGPSDASGVGPAEGDALGPSDPNGVGPSEGDALGETDSIGVGTTDGAPKVGIGVIGASVGIMDGTNVGAIVDGATVSRTLSMAFCVVTHTVRKRFNCSIVGLSPDRVPLMGITALVPTQHEGPLVQRQDRVLKAVCKASGSSVNLVTSEANPESPKSCTNMTNSSLLSSPLPSVSDIARALKHASSVLNPPAPTSDCPVAVFVKNNAKTETTIKQDIGRTPWP